MSIHRSLQGRSGKEGAARNVLKRHERLQYLISRGQWKPGEPVFGLPKIKQTKFKARKAAAKEAAPEDAAASTAKPPASK